MARNEPSTVLIEPLEDLSATDPRIREMLDYWRARSPCQVPARADLDPLLDIPHLAPDLFMVDVISGGADFIVRLVGTRLVERYGRDTTGMSILELSSGTYLEAILALMRACLQRRRPIYSVTDYLHPEKSHLTVERLIVPLRHHGPEVEILLVLQLFHAPSEIKPDLHSDVLADVAQETTTAKFRAFVL